MRKGLLYFFFFFISILGSQNGFAQLEFVENKGQWHENVQYRLNFSSGSFFLEQNGFTVLLHNPQDLEKLVHLAHASMRPKEEDQDVTLHSFVYKVKFLGSNNFAEKLPEKPVASVNNYYLGNDSRKWASGCKLFQAVTYKDIYPGIDIRYYSDKGTLKYDIIVHPGADASLIKMEYDGPEKLSIEDKRLIISTPVAVVRELSPYAYQATLGGTEEVDVKYRLDGKALTFDIRSYDKNNTLVIDPTIIFSSYTGSTAENWGYTATPGKDGSLYAGGIAMDNGTYRVSSGAFDVTFNGGVSDNNYAKPHDVAIFKYSPDGSQRVYATYLGGSNNEQPHSMIEDANGNLIVAGRTASSNFPETANNISSGANFDIFVTKFNASGSALIGSVKIGGAGDDGINILPKSQQAGDTSLRQNYGDDARSEVIVDQQGNIILVSCTYSADFPIVGASPIQQAIGGNQDGVIMKFNPQLSALVFSTYFGGPKNDACFVASINPFNGNIYVGGATASSSGLPGSFGGTIQPSFGGGIADGFVSIINPNGTAALRTTYIASASPGSIDLVYGLKFDKAGFPYILGTTTGNWQVINAAYADADAKHFIAKMQPDLSSYVFSTVFGKTASEPSISPVAFMVDRCENVYVSGWGGGINIAHKYSNSNTSGLPETDPLLGIPPPDGKDFYFFVLKKNAQSRLFASHFGQNGGTVGDHVDGGTSRFDENGVIYQGICSCGSPSFPTTPGAIYTSNGSASCNQVAVKILMNFAGVGAKLGVDGKMKGCVPFTVNFKDLLQQGVKYYWQFGDGSSQQVTTVPSSTHTFNNPGNFTVMLIAEDSSTCNIRDTSYITITASNKKSLLNFDFQKLPPCENLTYAFTNLSTAQNGAYTAQSFKWDFGDGSPLVIAGTNGVQHTYATAGIYTVKLILEDSTFCNHPDTLSKTLRLNPQVKASFSYISSGCVPDTVHFNNTSLAGTDFIWQFENGTVFSTDENPVHIFTLPGTYKVRLIAIDDNSCNKRDTSTYKTIVVYPIPDAAFTWGPNPPQVNVPVTFTNQSTDAVTYLWNFGDGHSSSLANPVHEYDATGTFSVLLVATNQAGCVDSVRQSVNTLIVPLLDVPNAFTPGKFGVNSIVKVRGYGIVKMKWNIYNRWGELVFSSENKEQGWDGSYKGKQQPMDTYAYTLDAEFYDGKKVRKSGDITLMR